MTDHAFIVAEISKNWVNGFAHDGSDVSIGQLFESVLNVNAARGYRLSSFQLHRASPDAESLNETIIAVFERIPPIAPYPEVPRDLFDGQRLSAWDAISRAYFRGMVAGAAQPTEPRG